MFHDFLNLFYPRNCYCCEAALLKNEEVLCTQCLHELPVINYHREPDNPVRRIFLGRIPVENATSLLLFEKKGPVQQLIHHLKYRGHQEIGQYFGRWLGTELMEMEPYQEITAVIPVPLHKSRLRERGYNQVTLFGQEISAALGVPFRDDILLKKSVSRTQTRKDRFARWGTLEQHFVVERPEELKDAHILLVDDLVTTGATLEACALKLLEIPGTRISFATMAMTYLNF